MINTLTRVEFSSSSNSAPEKANVEHTEVLTRASEARDAYAFLVQLQTVLSHQNEAIPINAITTSLLQVISFFVDKTSNPKNYDREKELFWGKTVNRPDRNDRQVIKDKVLNSSHASYIEIYALTESAQKSLTSNTAQLRFVTGMIYEQLRALTVHRRAEVQKSPHGKEQNLPFAALESKKSYSIVIHKGKCAMKIEVQCNLLTDNEFGNFHQHIFDKVFSNTQTIWKDLSVAEFTAEIESRSRIGYAGSENIADAKKRRTDLNDLTAGDLAVVLCSSSEMQLNTLQQDYRGDTYGVGFPVALFFGVDEFNKITKFATNNSHPYTDGAFAIEEIKRISANVFEQHISNTSQEEQLLTQPEAVAQKTCCTVYEQVIQKDTYAKRIVLLRNSFPAIVNLHDNFRNINFQNLLTLAIMVAHDHQHAHFLEGVQVLRDQNNFSGLAPAVCVLPELVRQHVRSKSNKDTEYYNTLITCLSILQQSRKQTQEGRGPAHILGSLLSHDWLRKSMYGVGYLFDTLKTSMLTNTTLFSMLVRGNTHWETSNNYLSLQGFTTAFAESYSNEVYSACDRIDPTTGTQEVLITCKTKQFDKQKQDQFDQVDCYLNTIISDLENYVENNMERSKAENT